MNPAIIATGFWEVDTNRKSALVNFDVKFKRIKYSIHHQFLSPQWTEEEAAFFNINKLNNLKK